ncbi:hypothetical protein [Sphingobium sp. Ndbn-10]|uniref:hypothetical protein n=1 Tax=Sphingobium sp. Ndbn-10 TaxID=1667223 RepID=UPI00201D3173|nr:hypothetical protein [Sphingobium sp. Ndbn-10]
MKMQDHQQDAPGAAELYFADTALLAAGAARLRTLRREHAQLTSAFVAMTKGAATAEALEQARAVHRRLTELEQLLAADIEELKTLICSSSYPGKAI